MIYMNCLYADRRKAIALFALCTAMAAVLLLCRTAFADDERLVSRTDHEGRTVKVPAEPSRVVSLAPSITEIVFALDRSEVLAGATRFSNYPDAAARLPRVGSYVQLDIEKIVALEPDLCIAIKDGNPVRTVRRLERLGIPVFAIHPMEIDAVLRSIRDIGELLGADREAAGLISSMQARMAAVDEKVAGVSDKPSVFFQIGVSPIVSAGEGTFIDELIARAGGVNAAGNHAGYPRFTREEILMMAPDVMVLTSMARQKVFDDVLREWRQWDNLPAVREGRIHMVDSDLYDRPSPRLIDGLEELASLLHPDVFNTQSPDSP